MLSRWIQVETHAAQPITAGEYRIIPMAQSWQVKLPLSWISGGLTWNRPISVVVQTSDGGERVLGVRDTTRQAQVALLGGSLALVLFAWVVIRLFSRTRTLGV